LDMWHVGAAGNVDLTPNAGRPAPLGDELFYSDFGQVYRSDGTAAGTQSIGFVTGIANVIATSDAVFAANSNLWRADPSGTLQRVSSPVELDAPSMTAAGSRLYLG